jgi:Flp pilus assembly pilin Flp
MGSIKAFIASQIREDDGANANALAMLLGSVAAAIASAAALLDVNGIFTTMGSKVLALIAGS